MTRKTVNDVIRPDDQAANGKTYAFTTETVDVAGTPLPLVRCVEVVNNRARLATTVCFSLASNPGRA